MLSSFVADVILLRNLHLSYKPVGGSVFLDMYLKKILITACSRVLLEKLMVNKLGKMFVTNFMSAHSLNFR